MFMASNQYRVVKGRETAFERAWEETSLRLLGAPGIIGFRFDKGKELDRHFLYYAVTIWETEASFLEWRRVELNRASLAGDPKCGRVMSRLDEFDLAIPRSNPQ